MDGEVLYLYRTVLSPPRPVLNLIALTCILRLYTCIIYLMIYVYLNYAFKNVVYNTDLSHARGSPHRIAFFP